MKHSTDEYKALLLDANKRLNLYSKSAYSHLDYHIQDSVNIAKLIGSDTQNVVDLGSGSGLPSIPIAISNPNTTIIAVESKAKKRDFLSYAADQLSLSNYSVFEGDARTFLMAHKNPIDFFTAKAFAKWPEVIKIVAQWKRNKATLIIPISKKQKEELPSEQLRLVKEMTVESFGVFYYLVI